MTFKTNCVTTAALVSLAALSVPAIATEGGGSSYPVGVETNFSGLMPPEGLHVFAYTSYYAANETKDSNGNNSKNLAYFKLRANAVTTRLSYVWPGVNVLGANVETRIAQPWIHVGVTARPGPGPLDVGGSNTALGDTVFVPVILGWHYPTVHQMAGVETILPTGSYDVNRPVNIGRNTLQVAPFYGVTWFSADGWEASARLRFAINTKNDANNYQSGDEASIEFSGGYKLTPTLSIGLNGYLFKQTSNDTKNGLLVNNGNRGQVKALGPYIVYNVTPQLRLIAKAQSEFDARNRPQGTRMWLHARIPF